MEKIKNKQYFIFLNTYTFFSNNFNTVNIVRLNVHEGFGYVTAFLHDAFFIVWLVLASLKLFLRLLPLDLDFLQSCINTCKQAPSLFLLPIHVAIHYNVHSLCRHLSQYGNHVAFEVPYISLSNPIGADRSRRWSKKSRSELLQM